MKECPGCGEAVPADFEQCPSCGERMDGAALPPADPLPEPVPDPTLEPEADGPASVSPPPDPPGLICPECGRASPAEAQFCIYCRYAFGEEEPGSARKKRILILAGVGAFLVVAVVAALFLGGFIGEKPLDSPPTVAAKAGAVAVASPAQNLSRSNTTTPATPGLMNASALPSSTARANNTGTPASNRTLSPYIQNAGGSGSGEGGGGSRSGHLGSGLYSSVRGRTVTAIPTPAVLPTGDPSTDGYGYATGPLAWAGWGNWSPGSVRLTRGAASVVITSSGTTAVVLADGAGTLLGLAGFTPPGGMFEISVPGDGDYVLGIGAGNVSDTWTVSIRTASPVVSPTPSQVPGQPTETRSYSGNGGGSTPGVNLSPGTVSVQLSADQMTMAYLKDSSGSTLSTTVAGPNPGGSTATIAKAGEYHLEVWGTGTWSATVTWTGATTSTSTIATPSGVGTTAPTVPPTISPLTPTPTGTPSPFTWSGTGSQVTPFFDLQVGVYKISAETGSGVTVTLLDSLGESEGVYLPVVSEGSTIFNIDNTGKYVLDIQGDEHPWKISMTQMPVFASPTGGTVVLTGEGWTGLGPFYLAKGYNTMVISSDGYVSAYLLDKQGSYEDIIIHYAGVGTSTHAFNVPTEGSFFLNVKTITNAPWEITIKPGQ